MKVVAEGIETATGAELRGLGCEFGQGYLFSKPLSPPRRNLAAGLDPDRRRTATDDVGGVPCPGERHRRAGPKLIRIA